MKKKLLASITALLTMASPVVRGASDYLLEIDGIKGESSDAVRGETIEITSFSWNVSHSGAGGGAGKVSFSDFSFTADVSKAGPQLLMACATGRPIPKAKLFVRKQGTTTEYMEYKLENVLISSFGNRSGGGATQPGAASDPIPTDQFSLNFTRIEWTYREADGTVTTGGADITEAQ